MQRRRYQLTGKLGLDTLQYRIKSVGKVSRVGHFRALVIRACIIEDKRRMHAKETAYLTDGELSALQKLHVRRR